MGFNIILFHWYGHGRWPKDEDNGPLEKDIEVSSTSSLSLLMDDAPRSGSRWSLHAFDTKIYRYTYTSKYIHAYTYIYTNRYIYLIYILYIYTYTSIHIYIHNIYTIYYCLQWLPLRLSGSARPISDSFR